MTVIAIVVAVVDVDCRCLLLVVDDDDEVDHAFKVPMTLRFSPFLNNFLFKYL